MRVFGKLNNLTSCEVYVPILSYISDFVKKREFWAGFARILLATGGFSENCPREVEVLGGGGRKSEPSVIKWGCRECSTAVSMRVFQTRDEVSTTSTRTKHRQVFSSVNWTENEFDVVRNLDFSLLNGSFLVSGEVRKCGVWARKIIDFLPFTESRKMDF